MSGEILTTEDWNDLRFCLVPIGYEKAQALLTKIEALLAERETLIQERNSWGAIAEELGDREGLADLLVATDARADDQPAGAAGGIVA